MGGRFTFLTAVIFSAFAFAAFHLYEVQVLQGKVYFANAESKAAALAASPGARGTIYFTDKDGNRLPAAIEKDFPEIYAVPKDIEDPLKTANDLALILGQPADTILKVLQKKSLSYAAIEKMAPPDLAQKVDDAHLQGIYTQDVPHRYYPFSELGAHVLGFVGPNPGDTGESGKYGIEKLDNGILSGGAEQGGSDVALTIDPAIQTEAEHIARNLMIAHRGKAASVIVEDPKTGEILAMGGVPDFDPNNYASSSVKNFMNPTVEQIYEPGSVFKVLTMVAGIDSGKITPDTTFNDTGTLEVNGRTIHNWDLKGHGLVTMTQVIDDSINTGAAFAERRTGNDVFKSYLQKMGFGQKTGIDLPGELAGSLGTLTPNAPEVNYATASFGQGVSVTPLQVIQAIGSIANGGALMKPYVSEGGVPQKVRQVMSPETARKVTDMMVNAVDTAKVTTIEGYSVAGKTGTAQVPDFGHGGYTNNVIDTYIGFAPAANPKFIALIRLSEPEGAPHAAETVVPAFRNLAQFLLNYWNVPPDRIGSSKQ